MEPLKTAYRANAARILPTQTAMAEWLRRLDERGIEARPLKGLPLPEQAYDTLRIATVETSIF
jgi:hypothetical protein